MSRWKRANTTNRPVTKSIQQKWAFLWLVCVGGGDGCVIDSFGMFVKNFDPEFETMLVSKLISKIS